MQLGNQKNHISDETYKSIGQLCEAWSRLEALTEVIIWGVLGIDQTLGRLITWPKDVRQMWQLLLSEAPRKHSTEDINILKKINNQIVSVTKDRNVIIHGFVTSEIAIYVTGGPITSYGPDNFSILTSWTVYKGEHSGKRFPISEGAVKIVISNIDVITSELKEYITNHN